MEFTANREQLINSLSNGISDKRVLGTMAQVPRELFVPPASRRFAYEDRPLPIGFDQTISQPYVIALMTQALELTGTEKVLEVGTGSGYQAAILARLARSVISTERLPALAKAAADLLSELGHTNVTVKEAENILGFVKEAPYDAIIVTAGAPTVPNDLTAQLTIGGRMVIPIGTRYMQTLCKITRQHDKNKVENLGTCYFVPLIGAGAWEN